MLGMPVCAGQTPRGRPAPVSYRPDPGQVGCLAELAFWPVAEGAIVEGWISRPRPTMRIRNNTLIAVSNFRLWVIGASLPIDIQSILTK